eukprot:6181852-Pleurochrysis_carterae.AAC.1
MAKAAPTAGSVEASDKNTRDFAQKAVSAASSFRIWHLPMRTYAAERTGQSAVKAAAAVANAAAAARGLAVEALAQPAPAPPQPPTQIHASKLTRA